MIGIYPIHLTKALLNSLMEKEQMPAFYKEPIKH